MHRVAIALVLLVNRLVLVGLELDAKRNLRKERAERTVYTLEPVDCRGNLLVDAQDVVRFLDDAEDFLIRRSICVGISRMKLKSRKKD